MLISMKVVLLAGGLGTRIREETEFKPKPMLTIGDKPVLWHIMKNFAVAGHREFVILAGYKQEVIKRYFLDYQLLNHDVTLELGRPSEARFYVPSDSLDWEVTVTDTGVETQTGERLKRAQDYIGDEPFFCTYGDGVGDVDLDALLDTHSKQGKVATVTTTKPKGRFGVVDVDDSGTVRSFNEKPTGRSSINMGFFVFNSSVFGFLRPGEPLEQGLLPRLAAEGELAAYPHPGFWQPMDTYREYEALNAMWSDGRRPWETSRSHRS